MARYFFTHCLLVATLLLLGYSKATAQNNDSTLVLHTVQPGENLYRISLKYEVTMLQLMQWNGIQNPDVLKAGQQLKVWKRKTPVRRQEEVLPEKEPALMVDTPITPPSPEKPAKSNISHPFSPADSIKKKNEDDRNIVFSGTRIAPKEEEFDTSGRLDITGYISAYYAYYTDSIGVDEYQKFPTLSPHSNEVGLNLIQVSAKYRAEKVRGIVTLQWGDMPDVAWSPRYNLIQQANLGVRIIPRLWFDVGYFRTHIGIESVQPRENINSTIAVTTFVEPYYLSGAKLTWHASDKITLQANAFSQFNGFIENNLDKALGFSAVIDPSSQLSMTLNTITSDDTPDDALPHHRRWYNDFYMTWKTSRSILGFEFNYGTQTNSSLTDSLKTASMMSSLLAFKYFISKRTALYTRGEYCHDPDGFLSGTYRNSKGQQHGISIYGIAGGIELKPIPNSYVRLEYRYLNQHDKNQDIFYYAGTFRTFRNEFIFSTGFWF